MTRTIKSSPRRKHQTPPEQLREQIEAKLKTELSNKQHNKLLAVKMVLNGFPPSKISDVFGVHANTITAWVRKADTVGIDALLKPRAKTGGRTSALSKDNLKEILRLFGKRKIPKFWGFLNSYLGLLLLSSISAALIIS